MCSVLAGISTADPRYFFCPAQITMPSLEYARINESASKHVTVRGLQDWHGNLCSEDKPNATGIKGIFASFLFVVLSTELKVRCF
jgi:hypothetical protein